MDLKERRREEIILAARRVFFENGFERSKMEDIASQAGIGKGTIYGYFSSKEELFETMICHNINEYKARLLDISSSSESFPEKIRSLLNYHYDFLSENLDIFDLINKGNMISEPIRKHLIREQEDFLNILDIMLKKAIENKELRDDIDNEITLLFILGGINQICGKRFFLDQKKISSDDFNSLMDLMLKGLKK